MKRVFIIVGDAKSRKSSTIRALTGVGNRRKVLQIRTSDNKTINVFVCHTSLQEVKIKPEKFVEEVEKHPDNPEYVLVALRPNNRRFSSADEYISYFRNAGWRIDGVEHLQMEPERPANEIAHGIRVKLHWL